MKKEKIIYQTYKKFYGKEPDFNKENFMNLTIEIQFMAYILNEYGVSLSSDGFCYEYTNLSMPMSMDIQDIVVGSLILNSDDLSEGSLEFIESTDKTINIVGSAIKNITANSQNRIEELMKISNILYVKKHVCPSASDEDIIEIAKCTEEDLKNVEQLIEFIKQEKCKGNFNKSNIQNISKMINGEELTPYGMFINESCDGIIPEITEESRKKLAKSLINGD